MDYRRGTVSRDMSMGTVGISRATVLTARSGNGCQQTTPCRSRDNQLQTDFLGSDLLACVVGDELANTGNDGGRDMDSV